MDSHVSAVIKIADNTKENNSEKYAEAQMLLKNWNQTADKTTKEDYFRNEAFRACYIHRLYHIRVNCFYKMLKMVYEVESVKNLVPECRTVTSIGCGAGPEIAAYYHLIRTDLNNDTLDLMFTAIDSIADWEVYIEALNESLNDKAAIDFKIIKQNVT